MTYSPHHQQKISEQDNIAKTYQRLAKSYDFLGERLLGLILSPFGYFNYRKQAISSMQLQPGDTVIDLCCGTGLNFPLLEKAIGSEGKIIGVDLTAEMLAQAHQRVEENHWNNVELVQANAAEYSFPKGVDGILSTWAITLVPEFDHVIQNGCQALSPGKRWCILDFKKPKNWLSLSAPLLSYPFLRPFGANLKVTDRHPWEPIQQYLPKSIFTELLMGFAYIAVGEKSQKGENYE
ncbi:class I SAM-dependent methyltransferase [Acaryochloris sp. CCMEE 5410]|uniref:class I SAM-dependent methyltransferase n=1 Tax=Acaryochloris sp. CCMEE 5410 TaxID=310037 RepID=UPI00024843E4|nr:class I SAM-dependent methyltransferase [Acaryochloris sp. CCMEE 5410]KAI9129927.1 class I SAM-dependent methyltransferase [Acaryochloris sp. CCMEE 5410]